MLKKGHGYDCEHTCFFLFLSVRTLVELKPLLFSHYPATGWQELLSWFWRRRYASRQLLKVTGWTEMKATRCQAAGLPLWKKWGEGLAGATPRHVYPWVCCCMFWHLYSFTFTLTMTRASSRNVGKLLSDFKVVHRESVLFYSHNWEFCTWCHRCKLNTVRKIMTNLRSLKLKLRVHNMR